MKVVIINKSDSTGGAAVVSFRLMNALRAEGVDARMLVAEKLTGSPYVELAAPPLRIKVPFLAERLRIFAATGFDRRNLFKIDTASDGLPLYRNPLVREADVICLDWVNQGLLSFRGLRRLAALGKPIVWTMHDMWNMTGVCHHAGACRRFEGVCHDCPLLGARAGKDDLSRRTWERKKELYSRPFTFVAVSRWLAGRARASSLLGCGQDVRVIPNAFPFPASAPVRRQPDGEVRVLFGAARLDDPIKGLPILVEATRMLRERFPEHAARMRLVTFGGVRDADALAGFGIPHTHLGVLMGDESVRKAYAGCDMVVSSSLFETLPGTLVEGQAYGCVPVSFDRGGQSDIIDHLSTGYLARMGESVEESALNLAEGLVWAAGAVESDPAIISRMDASARDRFSGPAVARTYISLFRQLLGKNR